MRFFCLPGWPSIGDGTLVCLWEVVAGCLCFACWGCRVLVAVFCGLFFCLFSPSTIMVALSPRVFLIFVLPLLSLLSFTAAVWGREQAGNSTGAWLLAGVCPLQQSQGVLEKSTDVGF